MQRRRWTITATLLVCSSSACRDVDCPQGYVARAGQCVSEEQVAQDSAGSEPAAAGGDSDQSSAMAGQGHEGDVQAGQAGVNGGPTAGVGASGVNGNDSAGAASGESCSELGVVRCSLSTGKRESCEAGVWTASEPCPHGQSCVTDASGQATCVEIAELCRGSGGQTICDEKGSLIVCNLDETIAMQMACASARHCQAGIGTQTCPVCIPNEEFRCTGASLELCSPDGMTFTKAKDCPSEGLCNKMLGMCTDAVCDPNKPTCDDNSLVVCNADGTAIQTSTSCGSGTCDAAGEDCNACEPGSKKCDGESVATCEPTGQTFESTPCPGGKTCIGLGQCVECDGPEDCSALDAACKVGVCGSGNRCVPGNAPNGMACDTNGRAGTCSNGTCQCMPQCNGKQCGPDGCGGECGSCSQVCTSSGRCVECENSGDCDATFACSSNKCACSRSTTECNGRCIPSSGCCTASDCTGRNTTCNGENKCVCESSRFRECSGGDGCVVSTGCCPGESGRSCTTSGGAEGTCSQGTCAEAACSAACRDSLYLPCSQCKGGTTCSVYEVCTIDCSSNSDCPGGQCAGSQCRRPCSDNNDCLTGTNCSAGFCAWNGNG